MTRVRELICANRRLAVRVISAEAGISYSTGQTILTEDLNMRCVSAKFVPRDLIIARKETVCRHWSPSRSKIPIRTSWKALSEVTRLGLRIWSAHKTSVFAMEVARISNTEDTASDAFQSESHADFFLTWRGLFTTFTSPKVKRWINITMLKFWSDWDSPLVSRGQRNCNPAREVWLHHDNTFALTARSVQVFYSK